MGSYKKKKHASRLAMSSKNARKETIKNLVMFRYKLMVRLDEMQLQKAIRLSERIGIKPQTECAGTCKKRRADDLADQTRGL